MKIINLGVNFIDNEDEIIKVDYNSIGLPNDEKLSLLKTKL